jgi:hypothetical protein
MKAITQLEVGICKRQCSYTNGEELLYCCISHCTEASTNIGVSVMLLSVHNRHMVWALVVFVCSFCCNGMSYQSDHSSLEQGVF